MSDERRNGEHLEPELFVDLLEGTPVDASRRLHLESCAQCREELEELDSTLSLLKSSPAKLGDAGTSRRRETRFWAGIAAAAAVLLVAALSLYRTLGTPAGPATPSAEIEHLLPPVEEDEEFKLLLALSDAFEDEWEPEETALIEYETALDLDELTPEQRQRFLEELTEELRSSSL